MKKLSIVALVLMGGLGLTAFGFNQAFAQDSTNPVQTLVQRLAQKFNLNEADVQTVFDEHRSERQAQMQARFEERLTQAVTSGQITAAQKQLILAKHQSVQAQRGSQHEELQTWATQNGIDLKFLLGSGFQGGHMGRMHGFGGP